MKILIKDVLLENKTRDIFLNNGRIEVISDRCTLAADKIIDGSGKAAFPSFINGHTHAAMTLMRGYGDDMPLKEWLEEKIWPLEAKLTEEDVYWGSKLACLEMIKNGITVFNDMYWHWEGTARAVMDMGIRGFISAVFIDMFDRKRAERQREENIRLFEISKKYRPYVHFTLGPHAIYTVSEESLRWAGEFSEKNDILIHMHLSETKEETDFSINRYRMTPTRFLNEIGLLSERFIGCHGCMLNEGDCDIMRKTKAKLVHVPVSNLKLSVGRAFPIVHVAGIPFCFGTDGCASNNHLDIIETMKFASLLAKFFTKIPTFMPARVTFEKATEEAARIFRLGEWKIEEGLSPDIILIDLNRAEMVPNFDIYSDIVYASNGSIVDTVISMGRVVMEKRYVPGEEEIIEKARLIAHDLVRR
ncbi:MAG: amidohydrolase [Syntrophorhabdaceae bacterium]|nr:amidohydrolase [Syntrophorhabdaceae bacterium]